MKWKNNLKIEAVLNKTELAQRIRNWSILDGSKPMLGSVLRIFLNFWKCGFMHHSIEHMTSSRSIDTATAKESEHFVFVADWICFVLNCCFDWVKSHCCWHWKESKKENAFDHIHFADWTDCCWLQLIVEEVYLVFDIFLKNHAFLYMTNLVNAHSFW